jgi:hypothetical protein
MVSKVRPKSFCEKLLELIASPLIKEILGVSKRKRELASDFSLHLLGVSPQHLLEHKVASGEIKAGHAAAIR